MINVLECQWNIDCEQGSWPEIDDSHSENNTTKLSAASSRRLSSLGIKVNKLLHSIVSKKNYKNEKITWVAATRHGDSSRTDKLLTVIAKEEELSPTSFSMSVDNAILGSFYIDTKNNESHNVIFGGEDSFVLGLLEAYCLQKSEGGLVGYVYYDDKLSETYESNSCNLDKNICIAFIFSSSENEKASDKEDKIKLEYCDNKIEARKIKSNKKALELLNWLAGNKDTIYEIDLPNGKFRFKK